MKIKTNTIKGQPGLPAAKVVADKPQSLKDKEAEEKKKRLKQRRKDGDKFIPWPAGFDSRAPRRVEDGGELKRLKRRNEK